MKIDKTVLFEKLQRAIELELATIPPYLTAVFSMHQDKNRIPAAVIRSVFMEEMLHLTLAGNLLSAVGGKVKLGKDNIPNYPVTLDFKGKTFRDRKFDVNLARFSKSTIETFCDIEAPDWKVEMDLALKARTELEIEGLTIGEFYDTIKDELKRLCKAYPDREVFSGDPAHQISEDYYWAGGGKPIVVTHLKNALDAIDEIVEQGEGAGEHRWDSDHNMFDQREELAHYFRFNEVLNKRYYKPSDGLKENPSGDPMPVDYSEKAVYPIRANCKASDFVNTPELAKLNTEFNLKYSTMLSQLEDGFNGNPKVFYTAIMNGMHDLSPIAYKMVQIPINGSQENGAPSFEWVQPRITTTTASAPSQQARNWHVIQNVELPANAQAVWDLIGGFYTMHSWHPDISEISVPVEQNTNQCIRRNLLFTIPGSKPATEQLEFLDNENLVYRYKWYAGEWGEEIQNYHSELKVIPLVQGKKCMVQWSGTFFYTEDALSQFYLNGFAVLKKKFGGE